MATQEQLLESIKSRPDGVDLPTLAAEFETKPFQLTKPLSDLRKKKLVTITEGVYQVAAPPVDAAEKPAALVEPVEAGALPSEYDKFKSLGKGLGLVDPFLASVCDYIFTLGAEDTGRVYEGLLRLSLRPDIVQRWVALWSAFLGKPVPSGIESPVANTALARQTTKWSVAGGSPVLDNEEGEFTFNQALRVCELQRQPQQSGGDSKILELMISRQAESDKRVELLLQQLTDQRLGTLQDAMVGLDRKIENMGEKRQLSDRYAIMDKGMDKLTDGLDKARTDFKPLLETMALPGQGQPLRKRSAKEIEGFSRGLDIGIEKERELCAMEDELFFGKKGGPFPQRAPLPPRPLVPRPEVSYE